MTATPGLEAGRTGAASVVVTGALTAAAVGSGSIAVYATPMMIALMEAAAVDCVEALLPAGHVSLGTRIDVTHQAPTPVGGHVEATAELVALKGRQLTFRVIARAGGEIIGEGTHKRVIVEKARFEAKLSGQRTS